MLFNSLSFLIFLPIVFAAYWAVPKRFQWAVVLAASYYFYMSWNIKYVGLILFTTAVSYAAAIMIERAGGDEKKRKLYLAAASAASLLTLFFFKYFNFFAESFAALMRAAGLKTDAVLLNVMLPVGISFYTFQTMSYVIDVYRGSVKAERHFGKYAAFVSFFPQLVAGPIERTSNLMPQICEPRTFDYRQAAYGMKLMAWGFFKKVIIADTLAIFVDQAYGNVAAYEGFALVLATFYFTVQIYCDFSGYSDIAAGTAKLFGVELMTNFRSPYFSESVKEFWSRWHISLSTWFRDYVYIPLGGNRVSKLRHKANLMITFLVSGLWHGASWTFVAWGGLHGAAQALESAFTDGKKKRSGIRRAAAMLAVFVFVAAAWVFFRAQSFNDAFYVIGHFFTGITNPIRYLVDGAYATGFSKKQLISTTLFIAALGAFDYFSLKKDIIAETERLKTPVRWLLYIGILYVLIAFMPHEGSAEFIYFQF